MAIAPTGAIYKSLIFDGEDSRNYGVYITGEAVYNAPQRAVEMISIPNRNGAFALDKGYFENIEVTYPAGIFADNETNFAQAISDFRNFLCSRKGYVRLSDEYNPDEYRMAVYKSGLEVSPTQLRAGEFEITFDCKPQRFLTSGDYEITIGQWGEIQTASGSIATFEGNGATGIKSLIAEINPVQAGSGTPSPSNPRAISGWDGVSAYVRGVNQWDEQWELGGLIWSTGATMPASDRIRSINYCNCIPNTTYYVKSPNTYTSAFWYDASKAFIGYNTTNNAMVTSPPTARYFKLVNTGVTTYNNDICINYPSTETAYHAYNGETKTVSLGQTVYGGTLDVTSGTLTVTHGITTVNDLTWTYNSSSAVFWASVSGMLRPCTLTCSHYAQDFSTTVQAIPNNRIWNEKYAYSSTNVVIKDTRFTDAATFKSNMSGVQIVYELATPTTVQLTAQQLSAISGINNVWADSGDVTVQYGNAPNMIYNPTLFDAKPLLEVEGYGNINIGDDTITLNDVAMGEIDICSALNPSSTSSGLSYTFALVFRDENINNGDSIYIPQVKARFEQVKKTDYTKLSCSVTSTSSATGSCTSSGTEKRIDMENVGFTYGTASTKSGSVTFSQKYTYNGSESTVSRTLSLSIAYTTPKTITITLTLSNTIACFNTSGKSLYISKTYADSTKSALGHPTYIDLDIGEAYLISNGVPVSLNNVASLPNELPVLKPDGTEITYDNTVTDLKVVPHWWKV